MNYYIVTNNSNKVLGQHRSKPDELNYITIYEVGQILHNVGDSPLPWPSDMSLDIYFDIVTNTLYSVDNRPLNTLKSTKLSEISAWRVLANTQGFQFSGKLIAYDDTAKADINGVLGSILLTGSFPDNWPGGWKAVDNTYVAIPDIDTWKQFYAALTSQGTANFNHAQALKAQVNAATTKEAVNAIVW